MYTFSPLLKCRSECHSPTICALPIRERLHVIRMLDHVECGASACLLLSPAAPFISEMLCKTILLPWRKTHARGYEERSTATASLHWCYKAMSSALFGNIYAVTADCHSPPHSSYVSLYKSISPSSAVVIGSRPATSTTQQPLSR